jgi:hypothetical protein
MVLEQLSWWNFLPQEEVQLSGPAKEKKSTATTRLANRTASFAADRNAYAFKPQPNSHHQAANPARLCLRPGPKGPKLVCMQLASACCPSITMDGKEHMPLDQNRRKYC